MSDGRLFSSDVGFTPAVKAIQSRKGSRMAYAHVEDRGGWRKSLEIRNRHKGLHGIESIHGIISYIAII